jgi:alkylation response protein AidB-like acyl-CoA dehydrogenase
MAQLSVIIFAFACGAYAGLLSLRIDRVNTRVASLEKDLARESGYNSVSSAEFSAMRKEAAEHEARIDAARKLSDDAIAHCNYEGNVAVDGLDTFIGGRVVCLSPTGRIVFIEEPHWPKED